MPPPPSVTADDLRALDIPVKILVGGKTRVFWKIVARTAVALLPSAEFLSIDGATHFWPGLEPDEFGRLLLDFLAQS